MSDEPALSQEQARALAALMLLCLQEHGGDGLMIDEDDEPGTFRMARVGDVFVLADFAPDPAKSRLRRVDLYLAESGEGPVPTDRRTRLVSFQATHFGLPPDWHVEIDRPPAEWLGYAMT